MKEQRITIEIDHEGRISADADGFSGDACLRDLDCLLEGLSVGKTRMEHKPEAGSARATAARVLSVGKKP